MVIPQLRTFLTTVDDLLAQATRCLAAIRITVRKAPEVLLVELKGTKVADWLFVRMCAVLYNINDGRMRVEIVSALAEVLKIWRDAVPKTWNELRKFVEIIKSYISCMCFLLSS